MDVFLGGWVGGCGYNTGSLSHAAIFHCAAAAAVPCSQTVGFHYRNLTAHNITWPLSQLLLLFPVLCLSTRIGDRFLELNDHSGSDT